MKYSKDADYLVAAIMYLGSSKFWWGRTPQRMAAALNLNEERLKTVLQDYRGLFRESRTQQDNGQYSFSLHARYAQFDSKDGSEATGNVTIPPVSLETVKLLLDFVQKMVDHEMADERTRQANELADKRTREANELAEVRARQANRVPIRVALISGAVALVVSVISIAKDFRSPPAPAAAPAAQSAK